MLGDSSPSPTSSMGASSMGGASSMSPGSLGGMQPTGGAPNPMGNQQSFNFNQMGGIMPGSGSRHFGMRRNMLKQTQVGRYNSRPPQGLADTAGLQAMQAKLGSAHNANGLAKEALRASLHASKNAALSPALAGQDTSALGLSLGVPPMNPQQPMGQPAPQQGAMPGQAPMPPQGGMPQQGMPMQQDPSMQGSPPMGDPNAQAMGAPGGMPPAPGGQPVQPGVQPAMPGDPPPAVQNSGNLVSGLAAQQEGIDENDPAAASDEIAIEAAPGLESGMPKIGSSNPGLKKAQFALPEFKGDKLVKDPYIAKLDKLKKQGAITDFAHAFISRCVERGVNYKQAAQRVESAFGETAAAEVLQGWTALETDKQAWDNSDSAMTGGVSLAAAGLGAGRSAHKLVDVMGDAGLSGGKPRGILDSINTIYEHNARGPANLGNFMRGLQGAAYNAPKPPGTMTFPGMRGLRTPAVDAVRNMSANIAAHQGTGSAYAKILLDRVTPLARLAGRLGTAGRWGVLGGLGTAGLGLASAMRGKTPAPAPAPASAPAMAAKQAEEKRLDLIDDAMKDPTYHKVTKLDPNGLDMRRHATPEYLRTGSPSKEAGLLDLPGKVVRSLKNVGKQTIVPRSTQPVLAHAVPQQFAHLPVGASVPGELPKAPQRAFGSRPTPVQPTADDKMMGNSVLGTVGLGSAAGITGLVGGNSNNQPASKVGFDAMPNPAQPNPAQALGLGGVNSLPSTQVAPAKPPVPLAAKPATPMLRRPLPMTAPSMTGKVGRSKTAAPWGQWLQQGTRAVGNAFSGAGKAVANKANTFLNAAPKTTQIPTSFMPRGMTTSFNTAPAGTPPRTWSQFGRSMFQGEQNAGGGMLGRANPTEALVDRTAGNWGGVGKNLADRSLGAVQGAFTGGSLEGPGQIDPATGQPTTGMLSPTTGKVLGGLYGAMTGVSGSRSRNKYLNALHRPMQNAFAGGALGEAADQTVGMFGGNSNFGALGSRAGFGSGLLSNAARANRTWARENNMNAAPWARGMGQADAAMQAGAQGTMSSVPWAWDKGKGMVNKVLGTNLSRTPPGYAIQPGANNGLNRALYGAGALGVAAPLAASVAGGGIGLASDHIHNTVQHAMGQGLNQAQNWAQEKGLIGADGKFDAHGMAGGISGAMVDRLIQGMGMDPSQMSHADKWSLLGGGAAAGAGALTGNPLLLAGGLGAAGYGGRNGLMELLGHAARFSTGRNTNQLVQAAMTPGDVRMTGQGWN